MSKWLEVVALKHLLDGMEDGGAGDIASGMHIESLKDAKIVLAKLSRLIAEEIEYVTQQPASDAPETRVDADAKYNPPNESYIGLKNLLRDAETERGQALLAVTRLRADLATVTEHRSDLLEACKKFVGVWRGTAYLPVKIDVACLLAEEAIEKATQATATAARADGEEGG